MWVSKGHALPLAWLAWRGCQSPQGPFPEALHIAVVELMSEVIPEGAKVVFLGDGEFDRTALQDTLNEAGGPLCAAGRYRRSDRASVLGPA